MTTKNKTNLLISNLGIGKPKATSAKVEAAPVEATSEVRPSTENGCKTGEARTTVILNKELVKKVKYIALAEGTSIKDKVTEGLTAIVEQWEASNGEIPIRQYNKTMKRIILSFILVIWAAISFAQESVKPSYGVKTERPVAIALINGKTYYDVTVELSSAEFIGMFVEGVKVTVRDEDGKKIYKKRFSKSLLYAFSDGTIQIGKGNAVTNMTLYKDSDTRKWYMVLREKGIY